MVAAKTAAAAVAAALGALLLGTAPVAAAGAVGVRNTVNCSEVNPPPCVGDTACALLVGRGSGNGAGRCVAGSLADAAMPCGPAAVGWMCISGNGHLRLRHRSKSDVAEEASTAAAGATDDKGDAAAMPQPSPVASIVIADVGSSDSAAVADAAADAAAAAAHADASFAADDAAAAAEADADAAAAADEADAAAAAAAKMDSEAAAAAEAATAAADTADELLSPAEAADGDEGMGGDAAGAEEATDAAAATDATDAPAAVDADQAAGAVAADADRSAGGDGAADAAAAADALAAMKKKTDAAAAAHAAAWVQPNYYGAIDGSFGHLFGREKRRADAEAKAAKAAVAQAARSEAGKVGSA
ncbi:hypothetical protein BU14_2795s0001 [Porphyra umbilicalis]|uniref:Uncharacterized protein n=1 Tax=Porphyra umbilicalis TaxID=2786 RepID=A0A1X6NIS2_PORUM|nr:hypothetical protein BU14_2795s0001 [Porphyra umbilicalis]|eukprot:OSX68440.1 hypothetical protein BU14_2795s0001 [Porphyra umbilicalis]